MDNKELAEQLRIAAEILETGKEWEYLQHHGLWRTTKQDPVTQIINDYKIRIKPWGLPKPPEGEQWHRASEWKEGMLLKGERPLLEWEEILEDDIFMEENGRQGTFTKVSYPRRADENYLPIKTSRPLPQKKTKKIVPLGPEDVPPLSVIRHINGNPHCFRFIQDFSQTGVYILSNYSQNGYFLDSVSFRDLEKSYLIKRPTDADFVPAHKEIEE